MVIIALSTIDGHCDNQGIGIEGVALNHSSRTISILCSISNSNALGIRIEDVVLQSTFRPSAIIPAQSFQFPMPL